MMRNENQRENQSDDECGTTCDRVMKLCRRGGRKGGGRKGGEGRGGGRKGGGKRVSRIITLTSKMLVMDALGADALSGQGDDAVVPVLANASSLLKLKINKRKINYQINRSVNRNNARTYEQK